ncbi:MAG: sodium:solute symporter family protein [Schleiferiaceae bacterium]|nr:sodium:solute symporter family protein [Schleiferiaceae bacterium]
MIHPVDLSIFIVYLLAMLGVGLYFLRRNKDIDDYYVGGRGMSSWHIGLSVVATDVGGGFSIGLGGLGFAMGISGSWMLFTGLLGAWLAGTFLIPKVFKLLGQHKMYTFPEIFGHLFNPQVALVAGIVSAIGYMGFTSAQILAGAKLATATFPSMDLNTAIWVMGITAVVYTVFGGLKAVIYTDTVQWALLMGGLVFIGIPLAYLEVGGYAAIRDTVEPSFLALTNIAPVKLLNWAVTIIPIWFVGMTLYQRIYACRDEKTARKAWFLAGLFEYPVMAFMGVLLGLFARVALDQGMFASMGYTSLAGMDAEMGLPVLLRTILPVGLMGLMMSAYFSAIMSTADSCLMAASGNLVTDIAARFFPIPKEVLLRYSQVATFVTGALALTLATFMTQVLDLMLLSYSFMVSGLLVPLLAAFFFKKKDARAALVAMLVGGGTTLVLEIGKIGLDLGMPLGLDPNIFGISAAFVSYFSTAKINET